MQVGGDSQMVLMIKKTRLSRETVAQENEDHQKGFV